MLNYAHVAQGTRHETEVNELHERLSPICSYDKSAHHFIKNNTRQQDKLPDSKTNLATGLPPAGGELNEISVCGGGARRRRALNGFSNYAHQITSIPHMLPLPPSLSAYIIHIL